MSKQITGIVGWLKNWFYDETEIDGFITTLNNSIGSKLNANLTEANKNLVTNGSGTVVLEDKPVIPDVSGKIDTAGTGLSKSGTTLNHSNSVTAQTSAVAKKIKYDGQGHITGTSALYGSDIAVSSSDSTKIHTALSNKANSTHTHSATDVTDSNAHSNIGSSENATQGAINTAIDTAIGNLSSIRAIEVVSTLPTASSSTMGKLYIISENSKVNVYYTEQSGSSYSWHKMDTDILDDLVVNWSDVQGRPTKTSDFTNDGSDGSDTYVESGDLSTVATTGDYDDLSDKPNIPKVFYGTSSTSASTQTKAVTTSSDFSLESGVILFVQFSNAQDYNGTTGSELKLKVNNGSSINVVLDNSGNANAFATRYVWQSGEVVGFVYTGSRFLLLDRDIATTTYYGVTKLTDSTSSTSTTTSATPNSVKTAYDLANSKQDEITSIVLVPKSTDANGKIIFYTGDEPT